jgi:hypothetical protein
LVLCQSYREARDPQESGADKYLSHKITDALQLYCVPSSLTYAQSHFAS